MRRSLRLVLEIFIVAALSAGSSAFAAVGRTQGTATVSDNGAANYTIPIFAPGGTAGLTPELAFVYSSNSGNGALGVGWGISGLSRIERCPATYASNLASPRDVKGDAFDRFCRDGNQLMYFGGSPYGQAGAEYRTEINEIARIKSYGSAGTGPAYFVVEQKDGLIYEYGNTSDSRIEWLGSANVRTWAVNKIRDRSGNAILFSYTEDGVNGSYRISSIQYTGNTAQGVAPPYQISFVYEAMPSGEMDSGFMGNGLIKRMTRMDRVDVSYNSTLLRRYELTFEPSLSSTSRSRLQSIQECAGPVLDCLPATTFTYQNGTNSFAAETATGFQQTSPLIITTDLNGDGRTDLVTSTCDVEDGTHQGTWLSSLASSAGTYGPLQNSGVSTGGCDVLIPIDYNIDGRGDIMFPSQDGSKWLVLLGTSQGLSTTPIDTNEPIVNRYATTAIDVNADGADDLVWFAGEYLKYKARNTFDGAFVGATMTRPR